MATAQEASFHSAFKRATELRKRVISAIVMGIAALVATYEGGWLFSLFWLAAGVAVLIEWLNMMRVESRYIVKLDILRLGLGLVLAAFSLLYILSASLTAFLIPLGAAVVLCLAAARQNRDRLWSLAGFVYAAVLVLVPPFILDLQWIGLHILLWMFAVVWATDISAYFVGRRLGGPKLYPRVSPNKTWSGFLGGLAFGTLAGIGVLFAIGIFENVWQIWTRPLWHIAFASAVASVASQLGDLLESALKRRFNVKDSSHLIPGHGGVMDRLDGFWAVAALAALLEAALLIARAAG